MLCSEHTLRGYSIRAEDDTVGHVEQLLFDDRSGKIRYLVVRLGGWLFGRRVLVAPAALGTVSTPLQVVDVALTCRQIEDCPDITTHPPVSQQYDPAYAYDGFMPGWEMLPRPWFRDMSWYAVPNDGDPPRVPKGDPHLRSTREVAGYRIKASDGTIGSIVDFLFDDVVWAIRSVVVDTGAWLPGKRVLLPWQRIDEIDWVDSTVEVGLRRATIKGHPTYDPALLRQVGRPSHGRRH